MNISSHEPPLLSYPDDLNVLSNLILDDCKTNDKLNIDDDGLNILTDDPFKNIRQMTQVADFLAQFDDCFELIKKKKLQKTMSNHLQSNMFKPCHNFIQRNDSFPDPIAINDVILAQSISQDYDQLCNTPLVSDNIQVQPQQSTTVTPVNYTLAPKAFIQCNTPQIANNLVYQKEAVQNNIIESKPIQIICQPRSKFRPRTQNESKTSSHYLRCEDSAELDYPAISVPQIWASQSKVNIIEVALVDIEKQLHPYTIDNKNSKKSFDDQVLIFKETQPNILYFRLTNEDFLIGYKTFMIELIKMKQDDFITKKLIRSRKLDQSMLRFTRIYQDENGNYQRDNNSEEYSCIMTESYGDVAVERIEPRYGPMCRKSMIFIVLKGRFIKDDLSIIVFGQTIRWSQEIKDFILNGNVIYFTMPTFQYSSMNRMTASINIYYKQQKFHESTFLYTSSLDEQLVDIDLNDSISATDAFMTNKKLNHDMADNICSMPLNCQKVSKRKSRKRLDNKQISFTNV
ncbi:unnamed protein product [Rotaria sp. Silwood2]|nr:unnamed protein product [Rotaria sp. Silwood2]CAF2647819.1 unnamed protein product [Rotaria sp. Silwood2]CAF3948805.1 unnamed protein product [Rotaria sp. Silwood2]CAF4013757.1 unnamed protein product [Rotaria sp. Silwood2]CAF4576807.1 unnamed protein product [Rotaria sp. Silwood2]